MPTTLHRRLGVALAVVAAVLVPTTASAAPVTYRDAATGAEVDLSTDQVVAGTTVKLEGRYFTGNGGSGTPVVAIKVNDTDLPWTYGGASAYRPDWPDADIWFETRPDGTWSGEIEVPHDAPRKAPNDGRPWFRILSGVFSTGTSVTQPITFMAPFDVVERLETGSSGTEIVDGAARARFYPGSTFEAGRASSLALVARGFAAGAAIDVSLGDATKFATVAADADGELKNVPVNRLTIPAATAPGTYTLKLVAGADVVTVPIVVRVPVTGQLVTKRVRPGGTAVVRVSGFVGVGGQGQRVAMTIGGSTGPIIACTTADAEGRALLVGKVPEDFAPDDAVGIRALGGTACAPPAVSDPPGRVAPGPPAATFDVDPDAPTLTAPKLVTRGSTVSVRATGLPAGSSASAQLDDGAAGAARTVAQDGTAVLPVPVPEGSADGDRVVVVTAGDTAVATTFTAVAPPTRTITTPRVKPGGEVVVRLTGYRKEDGTGGQKVGVRLDSGRDLVACLTTNEQGDAEAPVKLPAGIAAGEHTLSFLAGSACQSGAGVLEPPARGVTSAAFSVEAGPVTEPTAPSTTLSPTPTETGAAAPPAPALVPQGTTPAGVASVAPKVVGALRRSRSGTKLVLTLRGGRGTSTSTISIRTASKVRLPGRRKGKVLTIASARTKRSSGSLSLVLTKDARALLRRRPAVAVIVRIIRGGRTTSQRLTLRR